MTTRTLAQLKLLKAVANVALVVIGIVVLFHAGAAFRSEEFTKAIFLLNFSWLTFWLSSTD